MDKDKALEDLKEVYRQSAQEYLRSLAPDDRPESVSQATQRTITLASLGLLRDRRSDVHLFNELLVEYPRRGRARGGRVVPDNMVVAHPGALEVYDRYDLSGQPARPLWVLDYFSPSHLRKDYEENRARYERELKVPYYLLFQTDDRELGLHRHTGRRYARVRANEHGRHRLPELELEVALRDGWVRYWFRGELLPLPAEMLRQWEEATRRAEVARQLEEERQARQAAEQELARLRSQLSQAKRPRNGPR